MKPELRTTQGENARPLLVRSADGTESRVIEGYAIVWGVESQILCDGFGVFIEIIDRGALTHETLATFDIRCLLEHNPNRLLARWREGNGTLALTIDDHGLKYRFEAPNTPDGETALQLVKRGDIFGSSFAYLADENTVVWDKKPDGTPTRLVKKIRHMEDVSLVSKPAYLQTEVSCRSLVDRGYKPQQGNGPFESEQQRKAYFEESRKAAQVFNN